jgi:hypothetical protein
MSIAAKDVASFTQACARPSEMTDDVNGVSEKRITQNGACCWALIERLESIERFLAEADAPQAFDNVLDSKRSANETHAPWMTACSSGFCTATAAGPGAAVVVRLAGRQNCAAGVARGRAA